MEKTLESPLDCKEIPGGSEVKASASNVGEPGSIPGLGRSPGEGNSNPLQYSCLENPMDRGAWQATDHRAAESDTTRDLAHTRRFSLSSVLESPGGSAGKEPACSAGDLGLIPGLGRSPGEGNGDPLQYSCLQNLTDRGAWWTTTDGVSKSWPQLSN